LVRVSSYLSLKEADLSNIAASFSYPPPHDIFEALSRFLKEKGYTPGTEAGNPHETPDYLIFNDGVGILKENPAAKPRKRFWGLHTQPALKAFLGVVWFRPAHGPIIGRRLVIDVYGSTHLEALTQLGKDLAAKFGVQVLTRLASEDLKEETSLTNDPGP
jgi:hypothetical protein